LVVMVAVPEFSLNSTTETSPFDSGLARTSRPPDELTRRPCLPAGSWSTAITAVLPRIDRVVALALTMLFPARSGAAICAHRLKWARSSVADIPLPTSSMSGSFQAPGPAYAASPTFWRKIDRTLPKFAWMSPVVRHRFPTPGAHVHGWLEPHSQMLK